MNQTESYIRELVVDRRPWGRAFGLLISCLVILIGIARSVAPAAIVLRSVTAGILTAMIVRAFVRLLQAMADKGPERGSG